MKDDLQTIAGTLEPLAGLDFHGKWRIQKAIEIARKLAEQASQAPVCKCIAADGTRWGDRCPIHGASCEIRDTEQESKPPKCDSSSSSRLAGEPLGSPGGGHSPAPQDTDCSERVRSADSESSVGAGDASPRKDEVAAVHTPLSTSPAPNDSESGAIPETAPLSDVSREPVSETQQPDDGPKWMQLGWPDPTPEMLETPEFNAVWNLIKRWDINVPDAYVGYCGATGNHVRAILDALRPTVRESGWQPIETAPKNGAMVDLWIYHPDYDGYRVPDCKWVERYPESRWENRESAPVEAMKLSGGSYLIQATHWRPQPTPPVNWRRGSDD